MKLSIIIVNYNVKYFLRQLLQSIKASLCDFSFEIIVVDNASTDGSVAFLEKDFSTTKLIKNQVNLGFSRANNIGIRQSLGEYVLLLNPDTILQEDTLKKVVSYMDEHLNIGALGCRMIDGSGHFLPESKRGFPSPRVALFKSLGLSALFPKSRYFNEYYLGHLNEFDIHEIDVLTGAFMLLRRSALDVSGLLDEDFFMYGEDIDLSYRIKKQGYAVVYYPLTTIIHFKGESTKKQTVEYVRRFYGAMQIFARKHYKGGRGLWLRLILQVGIIFRAMLAILGQAIRKFGPLLLEWIVIAGVLKVFSLLWAQFYFHDRDYYDLSNIHLNICLYASIWIVALLLSGAYDQLFHWRRVIRGVLIGWVTIAAIYGFLGPSFRPSRSLVLVGGPLVSGAIFIMRTIYFRYVKHSWPFREHIQRKYAIVGPKELADKIQRLLKSNQQRLKYGGYVDHDNPGASNSYYLGSLEHLDQIVRFHQLEEIIFCSGSIASSEIMQWMTRLGSKLRYKIAPDQPLGIIGSSSKNNSGELYTFEIQYNLGQTYLLRNKRILDLSLAVIFLIISPLLLIFIKNKKIFLSNTLEILLGHKTWVSYGSAQANEFFPTLKPGILHPALVLYRENEIQALLDADYYYARDYSIGKDLSLVINNLKNLGNRNHCKH